MEYFDITVVAAVIVVIVSIAVRFLSITFSKKRTNVVEEETTHTNISSLHTIPEEDEEHLQEISRCAILLANYDPDEGTEKGSAELSKSRGDGLENLLLKPDELDADDGDSLMVNLPENIVEEQEADLIDLTADDISVAEDTEPDNDLSPQDMADIANELDTSMTGMNSQEDEIADGMDELVISENESTIEDFYESYVTDRPKIIELSDDENDQYLDRSEIQHKGKRSQGETGNVAEAYSDQSVSPTPLSQAREGKTADENISTKEDATSIISNEVVTGQSDLMEKDQLLEATSSKNSFGKKFGEISSSLTEEELEAEKRTQEEQLSSILEMLKGSPELRGTLTEDDIDNQMKLYSL